MTVYRTRPEIKEALKRQLEQLSDHSHLNITIQVENHSDGTYDTVVILYQDGKLLVDETYSVGRNEQDSKIDALFLRNSIKEWIEEWNIDVNEKIKEVSF